MTDKVTERLSGVFAAFRASKSASRRIWLAMSPGISEFDRDLRTISGIRPAGRSEERTRLMADMSLLRFNILRAMYLLIFVMVPQLSWVKILDPSRNWLAGDGWGFVVCMLGGFSLLCGLGLRHPLRMLPLLMWELVWKMIWMARIALPLWLAGKIDEDLVTNSFNLAFAALLLVVIPWRHVWAQYVRSSAEPWRSRPGADIPRQPS